MCRILNNYVGDTKKIMYQWYNYCLALFTEPCVPKNVTRTTHTYKHTITHTHERSDTVQRKENTMTLQNYEEQEKERRSMQRKKKKEERSAQ